MSKCFFFKFQRQMVKFKSITGTIYRCDYTHTRTHSINPQTMEPRRNIEIKKNKKHFVIVFGNVIAGFPAIYKIMSLYKSESNKSPHGPGRTVCVACTTAAPLGTTMKNILYYSRCCSSATRYRGHVRVAVAFKR